MFAFNHNTTQYKMMFTVSLKYLIIYLWKLNLVLLYSYSQTSGIHGERETYLLNGQWSYQHVRFNHQEHRLRGWVHPWGRHQDPVDDYTTHNSLQLPPAQRWATWSQGKCFCPADFLVHTQTLICTNIQRAFSSLTLFDLSFPYLWLANTSWTYIYLNVQRWLKNWSSHLTSSKTADTAIIPLSNCVYNLFLFSLCWSPT